MTGVMHGPLTFETLDFYRPWCRGCGAKTGPAVIAEETDTWVEDEDDFGFPYCPACVAEYAENHRRFLESCEERLAEIQQEAERLDALLAAYRNIEEVKA